MASLEYGQVRKGMVIVGDGGELFKVIDTQLNTPGNWRAILHLKVKSLKTGSITQQRVRPQDKVEQAYLDARQMQYLYAEGDGYVFMDLETYDQITLHKDWVGDQILYLKENDNVNVVFFDNKPLDLELPATVELLVTETEPSIKGATAAAQTKPATTETGLKVDVPSFISEGDVVQIDTRDGKYLKRSKE